MIIFVILIIIKDAPYHIIPIFGFRGLIRILPALINEELKGKLPKDVEKDAQKYIENKKYRCMKRFRGNATEALSRIIKSIFVLMLINLILLSFIILFFCNRFNSNNSTSIRIEDIIDIVN